MKEIGKYFLCCPKAEMGFVPLRVGYLQVKKLATLGRLIRANYNMIDLIFLQKV